jgi:hypothetical protein
MGVTSLRRYTNLAATIHLLSSRKITLLDPSNWEDRNDAYFMAQYKKLKNARSVLALCFAESSETYHHWRVFSHGRDGVCIEFKKDILLDSFSGDARTRADNVRYKLLKDLRELQNTIEIDDIPFIKRSAYKDEREFRIVFTDLNPRDSYKEYDFEPSAIKRITLSPWMPIAFAPPVKRIIKQINGFDKVDVYRSTLIDNESWKNVFKSVEV